MTTHRGDQRPWLARPGEEEAVLEFMADSAPWLSYNGATGTLSAIVPASEKPVAVMTRMHLREAVLRSMVRPVAVLRTCPLCGTWWNNPDPSHPASELNCPDCGRDQRRMPIADDGKTVLDPDCPHCREVMARRRSDDWPGGCLACGTYYVGIQARPGKLRCKECRQTCSFSGVGPQVNCILCGKHRYKIEKGRRCDLCQLERRLRIQDGWCGACGSPGARP